MASIATLQDEFNTVFDTGKWTRTNSTQVVQANEGLSLTTLLAGNYVSLDSIATYDLTGASVSVKLVSAGIRTLVSNETGILVLILDGSNTMQWYLNQTTLQVYKKVAGIQTQVGSNLAYDPSIHEYFRIRESAGTTYYDWSTDAQSWTNHTSVANPFVVTALQVEISNGTYSAETSTSTVIIDNINIISSAMPGRFSVGSGSSVVERAK